MSEHENLFGNYWWQTFGPSSLMHLLGNDLSLRDSNSLVDETVLGRIRTCLFFYATHVYSVFFYVTHVYSIISLSLSLHTDM